MLVLTFDAVLAFYSFSVGGPAGAAIGGGGGEELTSPVCEQRLGRWHASTCAMAFHGGEITAVYQYLTGRGGGRVTSSWLDLRVAFVGCLSALHAV